MMLRHIQRCIVIGKLHGMAGGWIPELFWTQWF
jgi:hypothetical protein